MQDGIVACEPDRYASGLTFTSKLQIDKSIFKNYTALVILLNSYVECSARFLISVWTEPGKPAMSFEAHSKADEPLMSREDEYLEKPLIKEGSCYSSKRVSLRTMILTIVMSSMVVFGLGVAVGKSLPKHERYRQLLGMQSPSAYL